MRTRPDLAQTVLAGLLLLGAASLAVAATARAQDGHHVSAWGWVGVAGFAAAAVLIYEWQLVARMIRPPRRYDVATLPPLFDTSAVAERARAQDWVAELQAEADACDDPGLKDRAYLLVEDLIDMEYIETVCASLARYDLQTSHLPVRHDLSSDPSGRSAFEASRESWRLNEPVVIPGRDFRRPWVVLDQVDACVRYAGDGVHRWSALHGRTIDPATGEVASTREEFFTGAGVAELLRARSTT